MENLKFYLAKTKFCSLSGIFQAGLIVKQLKTDSHSLARISKLND
ncbi:MAG: hypothetical protein AAFY50_12055 [Cyanobacteria bacterium J06648_1]